MTPATQAIVVRSLEGELAAFEAEGDEYHAAAIREDELPAARSLARLIHKGTYRKVPSHSLPLILA